jgi:alpha-tubulin suppressor-like RCC1 family protein
MKRHRKMRSSRKMGSTLNKFFERPFSKLSISIRIVDNDSGVPAGFNHSAAVTAEGTVYLWGKEMSDIVKTNDRRGNNLFLH